MENRPLTVDPEVSAEQQCPAPQAPRPRPSLLAVPDISLTRQSPPQPQGVVYPAVASASSPPGATMGYQPSQPPYSKRDLRSTNVANLHNLSRATPQYPSAGSVSSSSYTTQPPVDTSGLPYSSGTSTLATRSRYMDPVIESLVAGYSRRLLDLAPIPISQSQGAGHQVQIHDRVDPDTNESAINVNAWRDEEGLFHRGSLAQKRERSLDRLQQPSRDRDMPLDLSHRTSDGRRAMSSGSRRNHEAHPSEMTNEAREVLGHLPPVQSPASGQSVSLSSQIQASTSGQSTPTSLKRTSKSAKPYLRPHEPNTPPTSSGTSASNNGRFQCPVCHESLRSKDNLKTHMRIHTGERPYACAVCGADFADRSSFAKHMNIHTGAREYPCDMCERKFTQSGNLARHKKTVHGAAGK